MFVKKNQFDLDFNTYNFVFESLNTVQNQIIFKKLKYDGVNLLIASSMSLVVYSSNDMNDVASLLILEIIICSVISNLYRFFLQALYKLNDSKIYIEKNEEKI
ncbi:hypothetical protein BG261_09030 [Floricoccus tropicus]|uniref:Uncharacterized protein n=1 Tax=Floricoccus tropicus TaxID=1859473 RepID=A0A1E8GRJ8_9LACT|nr:hypothetical protein BG261_09030 [Floricoccus tropicus]